MLILSFLFLKFIFDLRQIVDPDGKKIFEELQVKRDENFIRFDVENLEARV